MDVEAMADGSILLTLFNGGIRNDEHAHMAKLLRRKSKILVAFGSCATEGWIVPKKNAATKITRHPFFFILPSFDNRLF